MRASARSWGEAAPTPLVSRNGRRSLCLLNLSAGAARLRTGGLAPARPPCGPSEVVVVGVVVLLQQPVDVRGVVGADVCDEERDQLGRHVVVGRVDHVHLVRNATRESTPHLAVRGATGTRCASSSTPPYGSSGCGERSELYLISSSRASHSWLARRLRREERAVLLWAGREERRELVQPGANHERHLRSPRGVAVGRRAAAGGGRRRAAAGGGRRTEWCCAAMARRWHEAEAYSPPFAITACAPTITLLNARHVLG